MSYATISACEKYRYLLGRWIGEGPLGLVLFVMLNPSKATAEINDPTITRCMNFARFWGFSLMEVVNLFAFRATDPWDLRAAHKRGVDVIGPESDQHIIEAAQRADMVVCSWGAQSMALLRYRDVCAIIGGTGKALHCISTTKDGQPNHPLMLKADLRPTLWTPPMQEVA